MPSLRDEIGDFVAVPMSFLEDNRQTAESRVVFLILRFHTNRKRKRAFPGYETIMRETGLSRQKTAAGIKVLVKTGWLVKHKLFAKNTEYEIRYPASDYSSTEELRDDTAIVPPANSVSSTEEQPPLNSINKIEINKIRVHGQQKIPRQPGSDDAHDDEAQKYLIAEMEHPPPGFYKAVESDVLAAYPNLGTPFKDIYELWFLKYDRLGGVGRSAGQKATLRQYHSSIKSYCKTWDLNKNRENGNGKGASGNSDRPYWMASEK